MKTSSLAVAIAIALVGPAVAQDAKTAKTPEGKAYLTTPSGAALYVFDNDRKPGGTPGAPTCYDQCAQHWPPFLAAADGKPNGDWTIEGRKGGAKQWAYKGRPLYTFTRDQQPGKVEGDGFNGNQWHLAQP